MSFQAKHALSIFLVFLLIFDFVGVSIICDEYLVVSIERICEKLQIPDEAAGASFLAFGSSAPEILIAIVSVASASGSEGPELGFSTVLGSAIIAFGLIPSLCRIVAPSRLELELPALIRDVFFCLISFGALLFFMRDGSIDLVDSGILLCFFPLYMLAIFLPLQCRKGPVRNKELMVSLNRDPTFLSEELLTQESAGNSEVEERESETDEKQVISESILSSSDVEENVSKPLVFQDAAPPKAKSSNRPASMALVEMNEGQENAADAMQVKMMMKGKGLVIVGEDGKETHLIADGTYAEMEANPDEIPAEREAVTRNSSWSKVYKFLSYPYVRLFHYTVPNCAVGEPWEDWYLLTFIISLIYLGAMSYISVAIAEYISAAFGVPVNLEGSFVLAFGAQIPDTLASLSMARKGLGPGAVANAIGSQIINVLLGVGVPFFFYALTRGTPVPVNLDYESSFVMLGGLIAVIGCYVIIALSQIRRTYGNKWTPPAISKAGGIILFVIYIASTFTIIVYNLL